MSDQIWGIFFFPSIRSKVIKSFLGESFKTPSPPLKGGKFFSISAGSNGNGEFMHNNRAAPLSASHKRKGNADAEMDGKRIDETQTMPAFVRSPLHGSKGRLAARKDLAASRHRRWSKNLRGSASRGASKKFPK